MQYESNAPNDAMASDHALVDDAGLDVREVQHGYEPNGFESGGVAVVELDGAGTDVGGERWLPPTQEAALDPELVAILCGAPEEGEAQELDGDSDSAASNVEDQADAAEAVVAEAGDVQGDDGDESLEDGVEFDHEEAVRSAAALLFASPEALSPRRLGELLGGARPKTVVAVLAPLCERFEAAGLPFVVRELAGGWRLFTDPAMAEVVQRLDSTRRSEKISPAGLETLSIIAYRQPVTKAEIEAIRGVQAGPMLRTLVDRGLVKVTGRADQPGSPLLYGTTQDFLDRFGLTSLGDLPRDGELARD
jgi:segregation and condensation protein B